MKPHRKIFSLYNKNKTYPKKLYHIIPNIITLTALYCGMSGLKFAISKHWTLAVICICCAALLDTLDGRVARMLKATSDLGMQLDSLADFVSFGVAPALLLYLRFMHVYGWLGWAICIFFVVNCILRLARFNVQSDHNQFLGFPSPFTALLSLSPIILADCLGWQFNYITIYALLNLIMAAVLMNIPLVIPALKNVAINQVLVVPIMLCFSIFMCLMLSCPWITILMVIHGYLVFMLYKGTMRI